VRRLAILSIGLFLILAIGCSQKDTAPVAPSGGDQSSGQLPISAQQLLAQYGLMSDGDSWPATMSDPSVVVPDSMDTSFDVYSVTFIWGNFDSLNSAGQATDWSGSLTLNSPGVIAPVNTIGFEQGRDSLLARISPTVLEWVSKTLRDFDGINALVFVKRGVQTFASAELVFATAPYTLHLPIGQMEYFNAFYRIDNFNALAVHAHRMRRPFCPHGLIAGFWTVSDTSRDNGAINAKWLDPQGKPIGSFRGTFWMDMAGRRLLAGKIVDLRGNPLGLVDGTWFYDDPRMCPLCGVGHGKFMGTIKNPAGRLLGLMGGEFGDFTVPTPKTLPLNGVWRINCVQRFENFGS
jgi:hypothetical protein